jgi:hypothetical protein
MAVAVVVVALEQKEQAGLAAAVMLLSQVGRQEPQTQVAAAAAQAA